MGRMLFSLLVLLFIVTIFAVSNLGTVTVNFWQITIVKDEPLALVIVGAGVLGALVTYLASLAHHVRQARQIRSLEERVRAHETRQESPLGPSAIVSPPAAPAEETRKLS